jgi:hypothetical protein
MILIFEVTGHEYIAAYVNDIPCISKRSEIIEEILRKEHVLKGVGVPEYHWVEMSNKRALIKTVHVVRGTKASYCTISQMYIKNVLESSKDMLRHALSFNQAQCPKLIPKLMIAST